MDNGGADPRLSTSQWSCCCRAAPLYRQLHEHVQQGLLYRVVLVQQNQSAASSMLSLHRAASHAAMCHRDVTCSFVAEAEPTERLEQARFQGATRN